MQNRQSRCLCKIPCYSLNTSWWLIWLFAICFKMNCSAPFKPFIPFTPFPHHCSPPLTTALSFSSHLPLSSPLYALPLMKPSSDYSGSWGLDRFATPAVPELPTAHGTQSAHNANVFCRVYFSACCQRLRRYWGAFLLWCVCVLLGVRVCVCKLVIPFPPGFM